MYVAQTTKRFDVHASAKTALRWTQPLHEYYSPRRGSKGNRADGAKTTKNTGCHCLFSAAMIEESK